MNEGPRRARWLWRAVGACGLAAAGLGIATATGRLPGNNLHEVVPGVYRSAQPSSADLAEWATRYGLASVLAVRPPQSAKHWYREEVATAAELGLAHHSIAFDPNDMPPRSRLRELVARIDTAERPLLMHCRVGIERTGLASAVALLLEGASPAEARAQFGARYGYVPWLSRTELPEVIDRYDRWLAQHDLVHTPDRFRAWVEDDYIASFYMANIEVLSRPEAPRVGEPLVVEVRVTNESEEPIRFRPVELAVHVGSLVRSLDPLRPYEHAARSGFVDVVLGPGQALDLPVELAGVPHAGRYRVDLDLVDEGVAWFADMGSRGRAFEIEVGL